MKPLLTTGLLALLTALTPARAVTILHSFSEMANDGSLPFGSVTLSGTKLYGMTSQGGSGFGGTVFSMNTNGSGFGVLHSFAGGTSDGLDPFGSVTLSGTKLYGMTNIGGSTNAGTVFSMNTDGSGYGLLHSFTGSDSVGDGRYPNGSLTLSGGKLYGMTNTGGNGVRGGGGVLFSMNTDGSGYSLLHTFLFSPNDASYPSGSLTLSGGKLYGLAQAGGSRGFGALFSINTDGSGFAILHSFLTSNNGDGQDPFGSLILSGSTLYGMTHGGGANGVGTGDGTIFRMNTDGTGYSLLHSFVYGPTDGAEPYGSLTLAGGRLYGMTSHAGSADAGVIFNLNTDGTGYSVLENFDGPPASGYRPYYSDLALSGDGSTLYGMALNGGATNHGIVFSQPVVPEPASAALLGLGALLLGARRRRMTRLS